MRWIILALVLTSCASTPENTVREGYISCSSRMDRFDKRTEARIPQRPCLEWRFDWKRPLRAGELKV